MYGTVRTVVWEDGRGDSPSYPIVDLFRCESIVLTSHWVLVVMDQFTRRIAGVGVHAGPVDGIALCRMFNHAVVGQALPHYLSSDHDRLFEYHRWQASLRILGIDEIKTVPYVPLSHPFVERLIAEPRTWALGSGGTGAFTPDSERPLRPCNHRAN